MLNRLIMPHFGTKLTAKGIQQPGDVTAVVAQHGGNPQKIHRMNPTSTMYSFDIPFERVPAAAQALYDKGATEVKRRKGNPKRSSNENRWTLIPKQS